MPLGYNILYIYIFDLNITIWSFYLLPLGSCFLNELLPLTEWLLRLYEINEGTKWRSKRGVSINVTKGPERRDEIGGKKQNSITDQNLKKKIWKYLQPTQRNKLSTIVHLFFFSWNKHLMVTIEMIKFLALRYRGSCVELWSKG